MVSAVTRDPTMQNRIVNLFQTGGKVASGALNAFVLDVARDGAIDFRPLHPVLRVMVGVGFAVLGLFMAGLLFSDQLRPLFPREILLLESSDARTVMVPTPYVPLTLFGLTLAWGFILAGGLYTRPLLRWLVFLAYVFFFALDGALQLASAALGLTGIFNVLLFLLLIFLNSLIFFTFLLFPIVKVPRPVGWLWLVGLVGILAALGYGMATRAQLVQNEFIAGGFMSGVITNLFLLVLSFLLISGLGWIDFALQTSKWAVGAVQQHADRFVVLIFLLGLLGVRAMGMIQSVARSGWEPNGLIGAALLIVGLAGIAYLRRSLAPHGEVPFAFLVWFAILLPVGQYLIYLLSRIGFVFLILQIMRAEAQTWSDQLSDWTRMLSEGETVIRPLLVMMAGVVIAFIAHRRGNGTLATFGLVVAWMHLLQWLMACGRPLAAYRYEYADVDRVMMGLLLAVVLVRIFSNRLTYDAMLRLLAIALLLALLNQTDFLDNPFSPLFGFAGLAFFVFGVFWNVIDLAGTFVNKDTPGLPRDSRALLYIGYVLMGVVVSHWFVASHNLVFQQLQNDMTYLAFVQLGYPLAFTVILEGGRALLASSVPEEAEGTANIGY
jgi:hypothetical protein